MMMFGNNKTGIKRIILIIILVSPPIHAEELFLHVKAKHIEHRGVPPVDDCSLQIRGDSPAKNVEGELETVEVCWQFYSWHTYKAKIKEVIYGEVRSKTIYFAAYEHTEFNKKYLRDFYVRLQLLDEDRQKFLGVDYYAVDHESPAKTICLRERLPEKYDREYLAQDGEYHCYYAEELGES